MKVTVELEIEDVTEAYLLFESVGSISTPLEGVGLTAERTVPRGDPIVWSQDGERRYLASIGQVYSAIAKAIMEKESLEALGMLP